MLQSSLQIIAVANELTQTQVEFERQSNSLSSSTKMMHDLLKIGKKLNPSDCEMMESFWSAEITADIDEVNRLAKSEVNLKVSLFLQGLGRED